MIITLLIVLPVAHCYECFTEPTYTKYSLLKTCHRSDAGIIARTFVDTVASCMKFASEKKGLAFNFKYDARNNPNCHILGCPEVANLTTLVPDEEYDYYTIYGNHTGNIPRASAQSQI